MITNRKKLLTILKELKDSGEKITATKVAQRAKVSHSLIYNQFPDVAQKIKDAKKQAKTEKEKLTDKQLIINLRKENKLLKNKIIESNQNDSEKTIKQLTSYIQELYLMYDSILDERNKFAQRISDQG